MGIQHILVFSFLLEKSIMDGVYVSFILVEHHLYFFFYFYILEELCFMVHTFIMQILGFQEFFFSSSFQHNNFWNFTKNNLWEPINDLCHELYFSSWKCCLGTSYVYCRFRNRYKSLFYRSYNLDILTDWYKNL